MTAIATFRRPVGRPTRLTPQLQARLVEHLCAGHYLETAAHLEHLSPRTLMGWLARGREEAARREEGMTAAERCEHDEPQATREEPFLQFSQAVLRARAEGEDRAVKVVKQVIVGGFITEERTITYPDGRVESVKRAQAPDGKLALEYLSRVAPQRWGRSQRVELGTSGESDQTGHQRQDIASGRELKASIESFYASRGETPPASPAPRLATLAQRSGVGWGTRR